MTHHSMMDALKNKLSAIKNVVPVENPVVYIDYPVHDNVGDLLIHQGADAFLEDYGYKVLGRYSIHDFTHRPQRHVPDVDWKPSVADLDALVRKFNPTLILHGGGNFGDIWPEFQKFRELIVERYPDTSIVIFPQSIHFGEAAGKERAIRIFGAHKKLHIFTRDSESWDFVSRECGLPGGLLPDMAHQLWGRLPQDTGGEDKGVLVQRRRDKESREAGDQQVGHFDWDDLRKPGEKYVIRALRKWQGIDTPLRHYISNYTLWRIYRDNLVDRAVARFRPYGEIDTDRLHGMILGALMAKKIRYGDGNYGKLHRYARAWLAESPLIQSGLEEAPSTPIAS
ncbi:polysaccharide pyruvyl transferase family protein [Rhizobium daejeonense]